MSFAVSLVVLLLAAFLIVKTQSQQLGSGLIGPVLGYWLKDLQ